MSVEHRSKSCEERIDGEWADRSGYLRALYKAIDGEELSPKEQSEVVNLVDPDPDDVTEDKLREAADESLREMAYGLGISKVYRYVWSGGGPADYLEVETDEDGEVTAARYLYQDWFDGARRDLEGDDFDLAERYHRDNYGE